MADPRQAFDFVMELEGGGVLHEVPGDPGGATKWGFSQRANPDLDIPNLTKEGALQAFIERYWDPRRLSEVDSQQMANEIAEMSFHTDAPFVNGGRAVRTAQLAANHIFRLMGWPDRLAIDGVVGPLTLGALNAVYDRGAVHESAWADRFNLLQLRHYRNLNRALVDRFFVGWTRRVVA